MTPVFDRHANLVAWFDGQHLFDLNLEWVAFAHNGHFFSSSTLGWLGPLHQGSLLETNGRPVAWLQDSRPISAVKPLRPLKPLKPLTPLRPLRPLTPLKPLAPLAPLGGWSSMDWDEWLNHA